MTAATGAAGHEPLRRAPAWRAVFLAQLRWVGFAVRHELLFAGSVVLLLGSLPLLIAQARTPGFRSDMQFSELALLTALVGMFAPLAVWKQEEPARRLYFWGLPVSRERQALARVLAGWAWLMAAVAVLVVWVAMLASVTGGELSGGDTFVPLRPLPDDAPYDRADHFHHPWPLPWWLWAVPFTAATATYLAGTAIALASDHPWRWYAGILCGFLLPLAVGSPWTRAVPELLVEGRFGLEMLVTGSGHAPVSVTTPEGHVIDRWVLDPQPARWLAAVALWGGASLAGAVVAARRHRDA